MATRIDTPVTLAQFKVALAAAEKENVALRKAVAQEKTASETLSSDLKAAQLGLKKTQDALARLERDAAQAKERFATEASQSQSALLAAKQENEQAQRQLKQAQTDLAASQARVTQIETQAGRQLAEATDVLNRMKLEAAAAADRELKIAKELAALKQELAQQRETVTGATVSNGDLAAEAKLLRKQVDGLVEENRRMAEQRDAAQSDQAVLQRHAQEQQQREAEAVASARKAALAEAKLQMAGVQEELQMARSRLTSLSEQLTASGKLEVVAPEQVGQLMGGFLQKIEGSMPSLRLSEGELKLKLGLARTDKAQGFVILPPGAGEELQRSVHEIALKFDRSGAIDLPTDKP
jgi:chromosome segregation ATPase